ncbi:hypothetical protein DUNSADRAFT_3649 [Dunaliella salina]|uniref:Encoded protein n=1 Tax=Dunaliella salina TaxID=3046 RepID=A0ABQ7FV97_DUNSA|nr:hypothetical protein DUNSADRAFT_3649 [Dunaliella salina]|eukprot:KAF5826310.1 hypothetical protein DUNSADRAFT_3649 [Dunaliella salina]
MPPKQNQKGGRIDYARPFFQRTLRREEIQEDIAAIQTSSRREHRAPARYSDQQYQQGSAAALHQQQSQYAHQALQQNKYGTFLPGAVQMPPPGNFYSVAAL